MTTDTANIESQGITRNEQVCWELVKRQQAIKEKLRQQRRWEDFQRAIQQWRDSYLNHHPFVPDTTANALFGICQNYGLVEFLEQSYSPTQKIIRTRGAPSRIAKAPSLEEGLREVGRVFD